MGREDRLLLDVSPVYASIIQYFVCTTLYDKYMNWYKLFQSLDNKMSPSMGFWWERQYVGRMAHKQLPTVSYMDNVIENFSCLTEDDYLIEGEMGMQVSIMYTLFL